MRKSHFNDEFLVLLGPIISRLFTCSNEENNNKKTKGGCSSPVSMGLPLCYLGTPIENQTIVTFDHQVRHLGHLGLIGNLAEVSQVEPVANVIKTFCAFICTLLLLDV